MGRKLKPGITFYRMDCGHIRNKKVRLLCNEFDSDGYYIWKALLDYGYMTWGYYFDLNDKDELELFATEYCRKKITVIREVIAGCIRRDLFNKDVADAFGILTCHDMQEIFIYATADRRKKGSVFEMQQDWLILDFKGIVPVNIEIVPGKKRIVPGNNSQTETETKTETKKKSSAPASPAPPKKVFNKKEEQPPEPFWQPMVDSFFEFYRKQFSGEDPSFAGRDPKLFKDLIQLLKKRAAKKKIDWTQENAVGMLTYFLGEAYSDEWLKKHFLIRNLVEQFDSVYLRAIEKTKKPENGKKQEAKKTLHDDLKFLLERFLEGNLDDRLLTPDIYSKLEKAHLVPDNYLQRFPGKNNDEQAREAIRDWLKQQTVAA